MVIDWSHAYTAIMSPWGSWAFEMHLAIMVGMSILGWWGAGAAKACCETVALIRPNAAFAGKKLLLCRLLPLLRLLEEFLS